MRTKQGLAQPSGEISASLAAPDPGRQENQHQAGPLETTFQDDHGVTYMGCEENQYQRLLLRCQ